MATRTIICGSRGLAAMLMQDAAATRAVIVSEAFVQSATSGPPPPGVTVLPQINIMS